MVEPPGFDPDQSKQIDLVRDDYIQNTTKKEIEEGTTVPGKVDLLENQHDHFKYIIKFKVNLPEEISTNRDGRRDRRDPRGQLELSRDQG